MTKNVEDYFVPWVKGIPMYISGHIELAWRNPKLHRMMSNENPHQPSEQGARSDCEIRRRIQPLPRPGSGGAHEDRRDQRPGRSRERDARQRLQRSVRQHLPLFLEAGDEVIQHTPCFGIYKLRGNILGGKLVSVPMIYKDQNLQYDPDAILKAITDKTKIIVIANPNNPTGNFMDAKDFVRIAETGIPFVVDEAYVEYAGLKMSQVQLTKKYKNVIITRTLSKAYGLAGMRFGYALGDKAVIDQISRPCSPGTWARSPCGLHWQPSKIPKPWKSA